MADENNVVENNEQTTQEPQYTEIQLKAIDQGWIPKEEFDGDPSEFIDAAEFVRRGELFDKIERQSRELKQVRQALEAFKQHHSKVKETEYERALKTLQEARKQAFVDGEHERAFALEEKIEEIKQEKQAVVDEARRPITESDDTYSQEFTTWVERNSWYESDADMREAADGMGIALANKGHTPTEVLRLVEQRMRKTFAHKFENPKASRGSPVEPSTRSGKARQESFQLTSEERDIMRKLVTTGTMSEEDYIKEIKAMRKSGE